MSLKPWTPSLKFLYYYSNVWKNDWKAYWK